MNISKPPEDDSQDDRCPNCGGLLFDGDEDGLCESCDTDRDDEDDE